MLSKSGRIKLVLLIILLDLLVFYPQDLGFPDFPGKYMKVFPGWFGAYVITAATIVLLDGGMFMAQTASEDDPLTQTGKNVDYSRALDWN